MGNDRSNSLCVASVSENAEDDRPIFEYKGQIQDLATTQQGSKYLQRVLAKASPEIVDFIILETSTNLSNLMIDAYGNYFC